MDAILLFFERLYFVDDSNEIDKEMSLHWCGVGGRLSQSVPPDFVGEAVACGCLCAAVKSGLERKNYERKKESAFSRICVNSSLFARFWVFQLISPIFPLFRWNFREFS